MSRFDKRVLDLETKSNQGFEVVIPAPLSRNGEPIESSALLPSTHVVDYALKGKSLRVTKEASEGFAEFEARATEEARQRFPGAFVMPFATPWL
ncbi:MAG: hypothetical protein AAF340_16370 [Pseudomonadota bacterium]